MASPNQLIVPPTFITLGPEGTDHENVTLAYLELQGLSDVAEISLVTDLVEDALERVRTEPNSMLVQCSAHQQVNEVNMRYPGEVVMVDTFMHPTMELGLVARSDADPPRSLGIMPATAGYVNLDDWEGVVYEASKPVVTQGLLEGRYDAGVTFARDGRNNPGVLHVAKSFGEVMTSWVVFANRRRDEASGLIGRTLSDFYLKPPLQPQQRAA